jgi:hypothetical protein
LEEPPHPGPMFEGSNVDLVRNIEEKVSISFTKILFYVINFFETIGKMILTQNNLIWLKCLVRKYLYNFLVVI